MKLHNLFFYLVPQYATKRQKSNIFEFRIPGLVAIASRRGKSAAIANVNNDE
jgi:hypothetical protein